MTCQQCGTSRNVFPSEIAIHFPGLVNVDKPVVMVFPKLHVCLMCGSTEFELPETERTLLRDGTEFSGAAA